MKKLAAKSKKAEAIAFMISANRIFKYFNNIEGVGVMAVSYDWKSHSF